jgi:hypothetical protein
MQETNSPVVLAEQAPIADLAKGSCLAGEQHPLTKADIGRSKRKPSTGGIGSLQVRALRVNDAAKIYGISRSTLYKMMAIFDRSDRRAGGLPALRYVRIGGGRRIPVDALEALIAGEGC